MPRLRISSGKNNTLLADRLRIYDEHEAKVQEALEMVRNGSSVATAERCVGTSSKTITMRLNCKRTSIRNALEIQRIQKHRVSKDKPAASSSPAAAPSRRGSRSASSSPALTRKSNSPAPRSRSNSKSASDSSKRFLLTTDDPTKLHLTFEEELRIAHHLRLLIHKNGPFPYQLISEVLRYYVRLRDAFQRLLKGEEQELRLAELRPQFSLCSRHTPEAILEEEDEMMDGESAGSIVADLKLTPASSPISSNTAVAAKPLLPMKRAELPPSPSPQVPPSPPISSVSILSPASSACTSPALPPSPSRRYSLSFSTTQSPFLPAKTVGGDDVSILENTDKEEMVKPATPKPSIIAIAPSYLTNFCKRNGIQSRTIASLCKESNIHEQFYMSKDVFIKSKVGIYSKLRASLVKFEFIQQQQQQEPSSELTLKLAQLIDSSPEVYDQMINNISTGRVLRLCFLDPDFEESDGIRSKAANEVAVEDDEDEISKPTDSAHPSGSAGLLESHLPDMDSAILMSRLLDFLGDEQHPEKIYQRLPAIKYGQFSKVDLIGTMFDYFSLLF